MKNNIDFSLSSLCDFWDRLDFKSVQTHLDEVALQLSQHDNCAQIRKNLNNFTRDWKKQNASIMSPEVDALLKQYQDATDRLGRRVKFSEGTLLKLYDKLYEAPDLSPLLKEAAAAIIKGSELRGKNDKLSRELAEYKSESAHIKNQDLTVRKLEEKVRHLELELEGKKDELEEVKVQAEVEIEETLLLEAKAREAQLSQELSLSQSNYASLQKMYDAAQSQLFAIHSTFEEEKAKRQLDFDTAMNELEKALRRVSELTTEKQLLVQRLESSPLDPASPGAVDAGLAATAAAVEESLQQELHLQRTICGRLRQDLAEARESLLAQGAAWQAKVTAAETARLAAEDAARSLQADLAARPTEGQMEELREQIRILEAVGFGVLSGDQSGTSASLDPESANDEARVSTPAGEGGGGGVEAALWARTRRLEHELTMRKLRAGELEEELASTRKAADALHIQLDEKSSLLARLEEDVLNLRGGRRDGGSSDDDQRPEASPGKRAAGGGTGDGIAGAGESDAGSGPMLRIVCGQRDRFRERCGELEEAVSKLTRELAEARRSEERTREDNVALVERLRYVHSYRANTAGQGASFDVEKGADVERQYGKLYDETMSPFREFKERQEERQRRQMAFPDKVMYMVGQMVFGSQSARLFVFFYLAALHLTVFLSLMRMTHHSAAHQLKTERHEGIVGF